MWITEGRMYQQWRRQDLSLEEAYSEKKLVRHGRKGGGVWGGGLLHPLPGRKF